MPDPRHIVVIRFSAMGDVAMAVPVIKAVLQQYPHVHLTFVSNAFFEPLFKNIERCNFYPAYTKGIHKGIAGIWKLYKALKNEQDFDAVADLHNVLRSNLLRKFFSLSAVLNAVIDKGRSDKKKLTAKKNKVLKQLPTSHERYAAVFATLGLPVNLQSNDLLKVKENIPPATASFILPQKKLIGVAPFAQHKEKMYPLHMMQLILLHLGKRDDVQLLYFGAPGDEAAMLEEWAKEIPNSFKIAGSISFADELHLISNLSLMISMDSANMHLASMYGVPVVSIWGATHPFAGFYGFNQDPANIVQADLYCRPCSVFGNKPCYRGDLACMQMISTEMLIQKIEAILQPSLLI
ncbi:MAG TPA: glycosyltransferase family 9 protein, partial [Ferruginibacter sp.]|nr:glycosyltransferase family 9 protein [Ferruginibacter sp.]